MLYVSEFIGRPITDADGRKIGILKDLLASHNNETLHPQIIALEIKGHRETIFVSIDAVAALIALAIPLKIRKAEITPYIPSDDDLYLIRDVLDKQIIDTNGSRVVRVNDLQLTRLNSQIFIANVDISGTGLIRRLGLVG